MQIAQPAPAGPLQSIVELSFSAGKLARRDVLSKSDPFAILYTCEPAPSALGHPQYQAKWVELGRTETVTDNQSPQWTRAVTTPFKFEEQQPLRISVWDWDSSGQHDFLGQAEVPLGRLMAARGQTMTLPLSGAGSAPGSTVTIAGTEVKGTNDEFRFIASCKGLDKKDKLFGLPIGSSDPFLVVNRVRADGSRTRAWQSAVIKKNLNPTWQETSVRVQTLCGGEPDSPIEIECFDWDSDGGHDFIGRTEVLTLNRILADTGRGGVEYPLINPKKVSKSGYKHSGTVSLPRAAIVRTPSILDYVKGGAQINLMCAVDFTGSNGDPRTPSSLHYMNPHVPNEYLSALQAVGSILLE